MTTIANGFETFLEARELEGKIPAEVKHIMDTYNLITTEGMERALAQAIWVGICLGKGWK